MARGIGRRFGLVPRQWHHAFVGRSGEEELVGSAATRAAAGFTRLFGPELEKAARWDGEGNQDDQDDQDDPVEGCILKI